MDCADAMSSSATKAAMSVGTDCATGEEEAATREATEIPPESDSGDGGTNAVAEKAEVVGEVVGE
jgi:hypothetical protein